MSERNNTCCFSGHRKIAEQDLPFIRQRLKETLTGLIEKGVHRFCAGGALGFDTLAAQTVLELKKSSPQILLFLILPCKNQTRGWKKEDREAYNDILNKCDKIIYTSENYFNGCMHIRNRALVDMSSFIVCYQFEKTGGTAYTVNYAKANNLTVYNLAEAQSRMDI